MKPTLQMVQIQLKRQIEDVKRKLNHGRANGAPEEYTSKGEGILKDLIAISPEEHLAKSLVIYEQQYREWQTQRRQQKWEKFIESERGKRYEDCTLDNFKV